MANEEEKKKFARETMFDMKKLYHGCTLTWEQFNEKADLIYADRTRENNIRFMKVGRLCFCFACRGSYQAYTSKRYIMVEKEEK